jgi:proline iminopeptidase
MTACFEALKSSIAITLRCVRCAIILAACAVAVIGSACRRAAPIPDTEPRSDPRPSAPVEPKGGLIAVNGHQLWSRMAGHGEPLLLVPGGPGSPHDYFYPSFIRLEDAFQVIYFDAFGRGKSERARDPSEYSLAGDVDDIEGLRLALRLTRIAVYGHSYGGIVAQAYALKYPKSLSQLILADTLHSAEMWQKGNNDNSNRQIADQFPDVWSELQALRAKGRTSCAPDYQAAMSRVPAGLFYFYNPAAAFPVETRLDVYCRIAGPDADMILGGDLASVDFRERLKDIHVPTLILTGQFDRVAIPRYAVQYRTFMPKATFVMFERSGHFPFVEEPARHDAVVRTFFGQGTNETKR